MNKNYIYALLAVALFLRLLNIGKPIIGINTWRQADTAAMSRNFIEYDGNILHPQIDWGGVPPSMVEAEFQIYTFITSIGYRVFGVNLLVPRLFSIICSLLSMFFLYLMIKKYAGEKAALWSVFIYSILPLNILFQNQVQPEPLMLMSIVAGLYFFDKWIDEENLIVLIVSAVFVSIACLIKPTSFHIALPIMYLSWKKYKSKMFLQPALILFAVFTMAVVTLWYYYAHQIKFQTGLTFGIWEYGEDKWGNWKMLSTWKFWNTIVFNLLAGRHFTWAGFPILVFGIYSWKKNTARLFDVWLLSAVIYILIAARGNYVHAYYQFPFILPAVYYMGTVCARYCIPGNLVKKPSLVLHILLIGMIILSGVIYSQAVKKQDTSTDKMFLLAEDIKRALPAETPMIIVDQQDPVGFYNSHTKGWHMIAANFDSLQISMAVRKGARYLALIHADFIDTPGELYKNSLAANNKTIVNNTNSLIISLEKFK